MNIGQLITTVRTDYLDDSVSGYLWDDAFMYRSFTEAERQACNRQFLIFDDSTSAYTEITLASGTTTYDVSQKVNKIEAVIFDDVQADRVSKHEIERTTPTWRSLTGMTGKPIQYVMRGHKIRFIPSPDADDDGKTVYMEVFRLPAADVTASDYVPEIPEEYHRDLIYWVLHEAYKKQDADTFQQEKADYYLARFTEVFGEYIPAEVRLNQMEQDRSLTLRPVAYTTKLTQTSDDDDWS